MLLDALNPNETVSELTDAEYTAAHRLIEQKRATTIDCTCPGSPHCILVATDLGLLALRVCTD